MGGWKRRHDNKRSFRVLGRSIDVPFTGNDYSPPPTADILVDHKEHKVTGIPANSPSMAVAIAQKAYPEGKAPKPKYDGRTKTWGVCFSKKR